MPIELDFEELPKSGIESLYKFKSFDKEDNYKDILKNFLYLSSRTQLNDPFDSQIPLKYELCTDDQIKQKMFKLLPTHISKNVRNKYVEMKFRERKRNPDYFTKKLEKFIDDSVGIFSLTRHRNDLLLWAHYTDKHTGFCVEYDAQKLNAIMNEKFEKLGMRIFLFKINYDDDFPEINPCANSMDDMHKMIFLTKSNDWDYEDEWRVLFLDGSRKKEPIASECITNIYFGLYASDENIKTSIEILEKSNPEIGLYMAVKKKDAFGLDFEKI